MIKLNSVTTIRDIPGILDYDTRFSETKESYSQGRFTAWQVGLNTSWTAAWHKPHKHNTFSTNHQINKSQLFFLDVSLSINRQNTYIAIRKQLKPKHYANVNS